MLLRRAKHPEQKGDVIQAGGSDLPSIQVHSKKGHYERQHGPSTIHHAMHLVGILAS